MLFFSFRGTTWRLRTVLWLRGNYHTWQLHLIKPIAVYQWHMILWWMSLGDSCLISKFCPRSEPYLSKYQNTVPRSYTLRQLSNSSFVKIWPWEAAVVEVYLWTTIFAIDHHWKWRNKHSFTLYSMSPMMSWGWQPTYSPLYEFWNYIFLYMWSLYMLCKLWTTFPAM